MNQKGNKSINNIKIELQQYWSDISSNQYVLKFSDTETKALEYKDNTIRKALLQEGRMMCIYSTQNRTSEVIVSEEKLEKILKGCRDGEITNEEMINRVIHFYKIELKHEYGHCLSNQRRSIRDMFINLRYTKGYFAIRNRLSEIEQTRYYYTQIPNEAKANELGEVSVEELIQSNIFLSNLSKLCI